MKKVCILLIIFFLSSVNYTRNISKVTGKIKYFSFSKKIFYYIKKNNFKSYLNNHVINIKNFKKISKTIEKKIDKQFSWQNLASKLISFTARFKKHRKKYIMRTKTNFKNTRSLLPGKWKMTKFISSGITNFYFEDGLLKADINIYFSLNNNFFSITLNRVILLYNVLFFASEKISKPEFLFKICTTN